MNFLTYAHWISTGLLTVLVLWSIALARQARTERSLPRRKLAEFELELDELRHRIESVHGTVRKVNARVAMKQARDKLAEDREEPKGDGSVTLDQQPNETPAEWKARVRRELAERRFQNGR